MHQVEFNAQKHEYTKQGVIYDSVTKIVASFCNPFDADYWSTYKAVKDTITEEMGEVSWERYKRAVGGWKNVVGHYSKSPSFKMNPELNTKVKRRKGQYLHAWEVKAANAREAGTKVHKMREEELTGKKKPYIHTSSGDTIVLEVSQEQLLITQDFKSNKVYPEMIISNDEFQVAGMSDKVEKIGKLVHISDYKTSEKIERVAFGDMKMLEPVLLPDCNFSHYTMQLSIYGWMLEQQGYKVGLLTIEQLFAPHYRKEDALKHILPYRGDLVRAMLTKYRGLNTAKRKEI